jgi:hypothetical protein
MIPLLLSAMKKKLTVGLGDLSLVHQSKDGDKAGPPHIWIGDLPPKRSGQDWSGLPCVLLVPLSGHLDDGWGEVEVALICIVYNQEEGDATGGEFDLANLISGVTRLLLDALETRGCPLDDRFNLVPDKRGEVLPWQKSEQQPKSFTQATMLSLWRYKSWE